MCELQFGAPNAGKTRGAVRFIVFVVGLALLAVHCAGQAATSPSSMRQAALALEQQGKNDEAEAAWRSILKIHPNNPEPYAQIGLIEARQEHYREAVPYYRKALAINPNVAGLRLNLGLALFKAGQLKEAVPEFQLLLKSAPPTSPDNQRLTILLGMAYYGLADYPKAAPYLEQAADRDPNNLPLLLALAQSYLWTRQYQNVLSVYHRILILNSDSAEADMLAGEALDELKDAAGATSMFREAVKANSKEPNAHFGLGYLLWKQERYPEASTEFQAELVNEPDHAQSLVYLADSYIEMNRSADALPLLQKAVKIAPSIGLAHVDLGTIAADAGRNDDALRELTLAEKQMPDDVNVHWHLGKLYRAMGKKDAAKAEFDKAQTLNRTANEDLYKKMSAAGAHPEQQQQQPAPAPPADH